MKQYIYGIDVGGTSIKIGLFALDSMFLITNIEVMTPKSNHNVSIFESIYQNIVKCNNDNDISFDNVLGVGIDVPCPVKLGYVDTCSNLNLYDIDLVKGMKRYLPHHVEIVVANDATMAGFGENASLEKPYENAILITLGTGIGGGIIVDGKIIEGSTGLAGEIGHIKVYDEEEDKFCGCGSKGCLEQICGTAGILEYTQNLLIDNPSMLNPEKLTIKDIFDAAKQGDDVATQTVLRVTKYIGIAASILAVTIEPDVFIIGGGVSKAGKFLIDLIEKSYKEYARFSTGSIPFVLAKTGNQAGIIGSAMLVKGVINKNIK